LVDHTLSDGAPLHVDISDTDKWAIRTFLAPLRAWTSPKFYGLDNIPEGAALLVGNHTLYGGIDVPLLAEEVLRTRGRIMRGLAENVLIGTPGVRQLIQRFGSVRGTRANCRALFDNDDLVLVFPGGGREAVRRKNEKYVLKWDGRTGFARMAIEAGVPILPTAMIGIDDALDIVMDADHPVLKPVKAIAERFGARWELAPPLVRGVGPTAIPRPERFYFSIGEPIETKVWQDNPDIDAAAAELSLLVRKAVEEEINFLLTERDRDPGRSLWGRLRGL
jgi:1-acyl-sn-glycerol-3-phosphate acyltransferase